MWMPKPLNTDLAGAFARLSQPRAAAFAIRQRTLQTRRGFDAANARQRAIRQKYVRPENADKLAELLPTDAGDALHAILPGDHIFCDLLTSICRTRKPLSLRVATLSMSKANVDSLTAELRAGNVGSIAILISNFFEKTNVAIFEHLTKAAADHPAFTVAVERTHAKLSLFDFGNNGKLTIATSANLRSSQNIEQLDAFGDPALYAFHRQWLDELFQ
jgi:hypothetical protein